MSSRNLWRRCGKLALACGIAATSWFMTTQSGAASTPSTAPSTSPSTDVDSGKSTVVRRGNLNLALDFKGVFEPVQPFEVRLHTRQFKDEFIVRHAVAPGTKVAKGDILLELDPEKIDVAIAAAENDQRIAQANLAKAEQDVRLGQQSDAIALSNSKQVLVDDQTQLKRWDDIDGAIDLFISAMNSKIADYEIDNASDELDQLRKMYKSEDLTNQTADIVMKQAIGRLELEKGIGKIDHANTDRYAQFVAPIQREDLSDTVDRQTIGVAQLGAAQTQSGELRETTLVTAHAAADEAARNLEQLKRDREMFSISSAIDGIVVYGNFDHKTWHPIEPGKLAAGEKVQGDQILLTVFRPGELRLAVECPESQLGYFSPGAKIQISPSAIPDLTYEGICEPLPIVGESQGSGQIFNIVVDLPAVDQRLAPGFTADVNFNAGKRDNVLLVPMTAIWRDKVWITRPVPGAKPGQPNSSIDEPRTVIIGASDGQQVEIKSGLSEGDVILTQAKHPGSQN